MNYHISVSDPASGFIDIKVETVVSSNASIELVLPAWRPGRYELADFAQYIRNWKVMDANGRALKSRKTDKNSWAVEVEDLGAIEISYRFYATMLDAGSTFVDEDQLYVNPVNCLVYQPATIDQPCVLQIMHDAKNLAIGWQPEKEDSKTFAFPDFHALVDSPFISSNKLKKRQWTQANCEFHLWFQGECQPEWERLQKDFSAFIEQQLAVFGELPMQEFHFLFQIKPVRAYHGVEHVNSTVILLGPGYDIFSKKLYPELMGVSSHELFHCWNVKTIRPKALMPYDYRKENFSPLGYVAEGVTTYYGDQILLRSAFFKENDFLEILSKHYQRHQHNFGRENYSLPESSHDTWLDGYKAGIPHRKLSIYSDGALLAFMTDVLILEETKGQKSLDEVMRQLHIDFGKTRKGYSEADYWAWVAQLSGEAQAAQLQNILNGKQDYKTQMDQCLQRIGLECHWKDSELFGESHLGLKSSEAGAIQLLHPDSKASRVGLAHGDKIISVNGMVVHNDLHQWLAYFGNTSEIRLIADRNGQLKKINLSQPDETRYFQSASIQKMENASEAQKKLFQHWAFRKKA